MSENGAKVAPRAIVSPHNLGDFSKQQLRYVKIVDTHLLDALVEAVQEINGDGLDNEALAVIQSTLVQGGQVAQEMIDINNILNS